MIKQNREFDGQIQFGSWKAQTNGSFAWGSFRGHISLESGNNLEVNYKFNMSDHSYRLDILSAGRILPFVLTSKSSYFTQVIHWSIHVNPVCTNWQILMQFKIKTMLELCMKKSNTQPSWFWKCLEHCNAALNTIIGPFHVNFELALFKCL